MSKPTSRVNVTLWTVALALTAWVVVGDRVLTHWAWAMERGRIQASDAELGELHDELPEVYAVSRAFKLVAKVARPGVVSLYVSGSDPDEASASERDEDIRRHLEDVVPEEQLEYWLRRWNPPGIGSGIVLDEDGYILTNNHVVAGRSDITVSLYDDREYEATLVGTDAKTDLAVLRIDASDLHALRFGDSDNIEVGDWVIAVGAPFGLSQTVTHGIVSAKGRTRVAGVGIDYQDFIQTDAAINPGNSGGPLLNLRGEVIGINTAIATRGEGNAGIAFTIPSNLAVKIANQLKTRGAVQRGWLGVSLRDIEPADVAIFGLPRRGGVVVDSVLRGTPAHQAGMEVEDVILSVGGRTFDTVDQFRALVADLQPHEWAEFQLVRNRQTETLSVRLGLQPDDTSATLEELILSRDVPGLGIRARTYRPDLGARFGLPFDDDARGAVVWELDVLDLEQPSLRMRDLVIGCNGRRVETVGDLREALSSSPVGSSVRLEILEPTGDRRLVTIKRRGE